MENVPQQVPKRTSPALWIVLSVVVVIAAALFINYWQTTNTNTNANVANTNTGTNANTSASGNLNVNDVVSTNTNVNTTGWNTFSAVGLSVEYPPNWVEDSTALRLESHKVSTDQPDALYAKVELRTEDTVYASTSEYLTYVLQQGCFFPDSQPIVVIQSDKLSVTDCKSQGQPYNASTFHGFRVDESAKKIYQLYGYYWSDATRDTVLEIIRSFSTQ